MHAVAKTVNETAKIKAAKLTRSLSGLKPRIRRPARTRENPMANKSTTSKAHNSTFTCPQGGEPPGGGGTIEFDEADVLIVRVDVAEVVPFNVRPGGEKVQVVSGFCGVAFDPCGRFWQPSNTTWSKPFDGVTVTV